MAKSNIILIVADDMGYGDFGAFSEGRVRTPHLDALIGEGLCLTQHYSGSPVCSPTRASLLTGRYAHRTGALSPQEVRGMDRIALDEVTIGDVFKHNGYTTGLIGKWHNGALDDRYHPNARGFDAFVGFRGGWMDYWDWWIERNGQREWSDGRYLTDVFTDEAVAFVRQHKADPFFVMLPYNAPHSPLHAPEDVSTRYVEEGHSQQVAATYAMIEVMDAGVGRILDELETLGIVDNTLVMFTSDNGPAMRLRADQVPEGWSTDTHRANAGLRAGKGSVYEGGIRVPMIIRWPDGLETGREITDLIHFTDWLPTLSAIAEIDVPETRALDGRDQTPVLRGGESREIPRRFWQWNGSEPVYTSNAAMRDGRYKLVRPTLTMPPANEEAERLMARYVELDIEYKYHPERVSLMTDPEPERIIPEPLPVEIYDVESDRAEATNLADAESERVSRMLSELEAWCEDVEAERRRFQE